MDADFLILKGGIAKEGGSKIGGGGFDVARSCTGNDQLNSEF